MSSPYPSSELPKGAAQVDLVVDKEPLHNYKLGHWIKALRDIIRNPMALIGDIGEVEPYDLYSAVEQQYQIERNQPLKLEILGDRNVIDILQKKVEKGERKLAVVFLSGGQAGVNGAGIINGMSDTGVLDRADVIMGISAGVPNLLYTLAGQGYLGAQIYWQENLKKFLLMPAEITEKIRYLVEAMKNGSQSPLVNTLSVGDCMRYSKPLDIEKLRVRQQELYAVGTDCDTGEAVLFDLKKARDPITVMEACICIPGITTTPSLKVKEREVVDGAYADPIPLGKIFDELGCTDVLIVANNNFGVGRWSEVFQDALMANIAKGKNYGYNPKVIKLIQQHPQILDQAYEKLMTAINSHDPNRRVAFITPSRNSLRLGGLESDEAKLKRAFKEACNWTRNFFGQSLINEKDIDNNIQKEKNYTYSLTTHPREEQK